MPMDPAAKLTVVALVEDLFFASGIERALRAAGWRVAVISRAADFEAAVISDRPTLALVDLGARGRDWVDAVRHIRQSPDLGELPIIGFGPHRDIALRDLALGAGCSEVVANSKLMSDVPHIAERYAGKRTTEATLPKGSDAL